jgi:hypothetical protein
MSASAARGTTLTLMNWDHRLRYRLVRLDITGLSAGANTIPHGLLTMEQAAATVKEEWFMPTSAVQAHRTQAADSTNLYYTVDSGAGTTISVFVVI